MRSAGMAACIEMDGRILSHACSDRGHHLHLHAAAASTIDMADDGTQHATYSLPVDTSSHLFSFSLLSLLTLSSSPLCRLMYTVHLLSPPGTVRIVQYYVEYFRGRRMDRCMHACCVGGSERSTDRLSLHQPHAPHLHTEYVRLHPGLWQQERAGR